MEGVYGTFDWPLKEERLLGIEFWRCGVPISGVRIDGDDFWRALDGRRASSSMRSLGESVVSMRDAVERGVRLS